MTDAAFKDQREAFAFAEEIDHVSNPDEIVRRMQRVLRNIGLEAVAFGRLPNPTQHYEDLVLVKAVPAEWFRIYVERQYFHVDPVVRRLRRSAMPFAYKVEYLSEDEPRGKELTQARRDFRLLEGFVIPSASAEQRGFVWMSGERPELTPGTRPAIHLMALYAFERVSDLLRPRAQQRRRLTEREREVLTWVALGKTAWEIGAILSIAKRTVDEHTQTAARKLGAVNRTQAVALALRDRVIAI